MCPVYGITHPVQGRLATPPGSMYPTFFEQWCRSFYVPQEPDVKWKFCETGPMVYCPYPRRLESLTIHRCHCKGSTFWPWVFVLPGFEPTTSSSADQKLETGCIKSTFMVTLRVLIEPTISAFPTELSLPSGGHLLWLLKKLRGTLNELLHNLDQEK